MLLLTPKTESLPQLCTEFGIQADRDGIVVVSSRGVAERFGKEHFHVIRDIEVISMHPKLDGLKWFRSTNYVDERGRSQPCYLLTRDGFILLVMGWTGDAILAIKIQYILAFNLMEETLRGFWRGGMNWSEAVEQLREEIATINLTVLRIADDTTEIKKTVRNRRREITATTKVEHVYAVGQLGGRCPRCALVELVKDGERIQGEFDHFFQNSSPGIATTWLICLKCHSDLTTGRMPRDQATASFHVYQDRRRTLPGREPDFFGSRFT